MTNDPRIGEPLQPIRELPQPAVHKILFCQSGSGNLFFLLLSSSSASPLFSISPVQKQQQNYPPFSKLLLLSFFSRVLEAADATVE